MKNKTSYAVLGLGRYGMAVAEELANSGVEVLAVDIDEERVNEASDKIPVCKCADATDAVVLEKLDISDFDVVVVAMADSLEASVMAITLCKEAGVKKIVAKCADEMHERIFSRVGADKVVLPEKESGVRLAKNLLSAGFIDIIDISDDISVVETDVKNEWVGKSLSEINIRKKYGLNVIAVKNNDKVVIDIDPLVPLKQGEKLVVIASNDKLKKVIQ